MMMMIMTMIMENDDHLMVVKGSQEAKCNAGNSKQVEHGVQKLGL